MWRRLMLVVASCLPIAFFSACVEQDDGSLVLSDDSLSSAADGAFNTSRRPERLVWHAITSNDPTPPVIEMSGDDITMRLTGFYTSRVTINGRAYTRVLLPGHALLTRAGYPELPKVHVNVAIPRGSSASIAVVDEEAQSFQLPPPLPSRGDITRDIDIATVPYVEGPFYAGSDAYPETELYAGEAFVLRDLTGLPVRFQPFIYDQGTRTLNVFTRITARIARDRSATDAMPAAINADFDELYQSTFLNYGQTTSRYTPIAEPGRLLIIAADAYYDAMLPLKEWKIQRGLNTTLVKLSTVGTTASAIKTYITNEYRSAARLTYVILVGDSDTMPTLAGGYESADSDGTYGMIDGNDYYNEVFISRISARSVAAVQNQVAKFIAYEKSPEAGGTWYQKAIGIASAEGSPTDYARCDILRTSLLNYGYTSVAQVYDPSASKATLISKINEGASLINYIGHGAGTYWVTTGFSATDAGTLTNTGKLPFVVDVSCVNGAWVDNTTCLAEGMLQAGTVGSPKGAVAMYSASTNASWVPPTEMQGWIVNELYTKDQKYTVGGLYYGGTMKALDLYPGTNGEGRKIAEQYNIFGDASMYVYTKTPRAITVEYANPVPATGTTFTVKAAGTAVAGVQVTLSANGAIIATAATNASGVASLSYSTSETAAKLVAIGHNVIPYIADVTIGGGSGNHAPVANAGPDQSIVEGGTVTLSGSATDADGDTLTYAWSQTGGPAVALSSSTVAQPTFVAPQVSAATQLTFQLVANDGKANSSPDTVVITVADTAVNQPPTANAGVDQNVASGAQVTLDGRQSSDPEGDALSFSWTQTAGPTVTLSGATSAQPTFAAPTVASTTTFTFSLVVTAAGAQSAADTVNVVVNAPSTWPVDVTSTDTPKSIPDNNATGITSQINVATEGTIASMEIDVDITHTYIGDLIVDLICPSGTVVNLHNRTGSSADDIKKTYAKTACVGESVKGTWKLKVTDRAGADVGTLNFWKLRVKLGSSAPTWTVVAATDLPKSIPDNNTTGITSSIPVTLAGNITAMEVKVAITHTYIGDLTVTVTCPGGGSAILHNKAGGSADNINQTYTVTACNGQVASGTYKLKVTDTASIDTGSLTAWEVHLK